MDKVEQYLKENFKADTAGQYRSHLRLYFQFLEADPETYFDANRSYERDVKRYWQYLMTKYAPKSIPVKLSIVRNFLETYEVEFKSKFWKQMAKRGIGTDTVRVDEIPTLEQMRQLMTLADVKDRAFFLCMASSGMRESELIQLRKEHFDFKHTPTKVSIPGTMTKNRTGRITYISPEATNALQAWMRIRTHYITENAKRFVALRKYLEDEFQKPVCSAEDDGRVFPYSESRVRERWNKLLEKAGDGFTEKDPVTGAYKLHLYVLRKYFNTRLLKVIPKHVVEKLMGHDGYLDGSYDRTTEQEMAEWYTKGESALYILMAPENQEDVEKVQNQMEVLQAQVAELLKQSKWYKQNAMIPVRDEEGQMTAVPAMTDTEAVAQYTKEQKIVEEIKKEGSMEIWGNKQRWKKKASQQ